MTYKAKINNIEVTYKNRTVLEIIKQYIKHFKDITYNELKEIFGSIRIKCRHYQSDWHS